MTYEELLTQTDKEGLIVKEKKLTGSDGRIHENRIAIRSDIDTTVEKSCVLAEEIGHYHTSTGDITRLTNDTQRKQEQKARLYGYNLKIGLLGIVDCYKKGCRNTHEMAEYLDVTEDYLLEALKCYRLKYGICAPVDNYIVYFEPTLGVLERI